jgi:hypothetical protein
VGLQKTLFFIDAQEGHHGAVVNGVREKSLVYIVTPEIRACSSVALHHCNKKRVGAKKFPCFVGSEVITLHLTAAFIMG